MTHLVPISKPQDQGAGKFHIEDAGSLWLNNSTLQSAVIHPSKEYKTEKGPVFLFAIEMEGKLVYREGNKEQRETFIKTYLGYE